MAYNNCDESLTNSNCSILKKIGICNPENIKLYGENDKTLNWTESSITEVINLNYSPIDIDNIASISASIEIESIKLIQTPFSKISYKLALLDSNGKPIYENGLVKECPCSSAFQIQSNAEDICLTGRELIVIGSIYQKIVYNTDINRQSVHSIESSCPFHTFIIVYPKFTNASELLDNLIIIDPDNPAKTAVITGYLSTSDDLMIDLYEEFYVDSCIEDISAYLLDGKTINKNITFFLYAQPLSNC